MTLRLTDDEAEALRRRAHREGRSMQDVARSAIREYIDRTSRRELLDRRPPRRPPYISQWWCGSGSKQLTVP